MIFFLLVWSIATLGFITLAASMSKHQKQIFNGELSLEQSRMTFILGWLLLIISLLISLFPYSFSNGFSYWIGVLTFSALFVGLCLSYFAQRLKLISPILLGLAILSGITYSI